MALWFTNSTVWRVGLELPLIGILAKMAAAAAPELKPMLCDFFVAAYTVVVGWWCGSLPRADEFCSCKMPCLRFFCVRCTIESSCMARRDCELMLFAVAMRDC